MRQVAIVGLGLIGGSLGLALRERIPGVEVVGVARRDETAREAEAMGAVDRAGTALEQVRGADMVVLACPLAVTAAVLEDCRPHLAEGARVTDVGSAKRLVVEHAARVLDPDRNPFLGGHPMAGKEVTGIGHAEPGLFRGRPWLFTPWPEGASSNLPETFRAARAGNRVGHEPRGWEDLVRAVRDIGAYPAFLAPDVHDRYVALVSHAPFLVSAAFLRSVGVQPDWLDAAELASSGFRDISRLGAGSSEMYAAITAFNRAEVLRALDAMELALTEFRDTIAGGDDGHLLDLLAAARQTRERWAADHPEPA